MGLMSLLNTLVNMIVSYMCTTFGSIIRASGLWFGNLGSGLYAGFVGLIFFYGIGMTFTFSTCSNIVASGGSWREVISKLYFKKAEDVKNEYSTVVEYLPTT